MFLMGILIFEGLTARRLCKSLGVKGLREAEARPLQEGQGSQWAVVPLCFTFK
jgi:hypothetical protein